MTNWAGVQSIGAMRYVCGYCSFNVANDRGYPHQAGPNRKIWVCPNCDRPTYFEVGIGQFPSPVPGNEVEHLPENLKKLYKEARSCCSVSAFTSSVLSCRKLLMNIAVEQGADEGLKFIEYVNFLAEKGYIPPNGRGWVDHIRKKGNEATHEIALMSQLDAEELLAFAEMLLKFVYEFPARVPNVP